MNGDIVRIGFRRLGLIASDPTAAATPTIVVPFLAELTRLGVRVTNPDSTTDDVATDWPTLHDVVVGARGGGRQYAPLFDGFPERLPDFDDASVRFLAAAMRLWSRKIDPRFAPMDAWREALDFSGVGWWPASSVDQDVEADARAKAREDLLLSDDRTEWLDVRIVGPAALDAALIGQLQAWAYGAASLSESEVADFSVLLDGYGMDWVDLTDVRFMETRALLIARLWAAAGMGDRPAAEALVSQGLAPDDLLRLFATLTGSDVSLTERIRFPALTRQERRAVLTILELSPRLRDVFRYRGLWLAVAKSLHVSEYTRRYPKAAAVLTELRATRRDDLSTLSCHERTIAAGQVGEAAQALVKVAPTLVARQLRRLLHAAGDQADEVLGALEDASDRIPLRTLLAVRAQIADNGATYPRVAVTKRGKCLPIMREPGHLSVTDDVRAEALTILDRAVGAACAAKGPWGPTVWIAPGVEDILVPDQLRSASDTLKILDRGSRVAVPDAAVLRLFIHWREPKGERSDLDLSCVMLDRDFGVYSQVSWTNLAADGVKHSGDLTSAENGASEFIDVPLTGLSSGIRYIAPQVYRYDGPAFGDLPECVVGWMLRDTPTSDRKTFDLATVDTAFTLGGRSGQATPFLYDVAERQIVWLDAAQAAGYRARVERYAAGFALLGKVWSERRNIRPNVADLARLHTAARGAYLVASRADAAVTFGFDDACTYNVFRPAPILSDLL